MDQDQEPAPAPSTPLTIRLVDTSSRLRPPVAPQPGQLDAIQMALLQRTGFKFDGKPPNIVTFDPPPLFEEEEGEEEDVTEDMEDIEEV